MDITTLLGQYAFPIVACLVVAWFVKYIFDSLLKEREQHNNIMLSYNKAITNNTAVMERLCTMFEMKYKGKEEEDNETRKKGINEKDF